MADQQGDLKPVTPARVAEELRKLSTQRASGNLEPDEYEHRFSRMITELRDRRIDGRPANLRAACDRSLRALGVERIDLYQLHAPDPKVPFAETIGTLADLRDAGKIRWIGLSNVSMSEIREAQAIAPITSVQNRLNPFFRE